MPKDFSQFRPDSPPTISHEELLMNAKKRVRKNKNPTMTPNAFLAYRTAMCKRINEKKIKLSLTQKSQIAQSLWRREDDLVKKQYKSLARQIKEEFIEWYRDHMRPPLQDFAQSFPAPIHNIPTASLANHETTLNREFENFDNSIYPEGQEISSILFDTYVQEPFTCCPVFSNEAASIVLYNVPEFENSDLTQNSSQINTSYQTLCWTPILVPESFRDVIPENVDDLQVLNTTPQSSNIVISNVHIEDSSECNAITTFNQILF
ncbi:hypothetical protein G9A89_011555 [Geosiphon pyriformis]|nr:hypothetical protein G9A89_011555 [Geosiphon pyriformis]